MEQVLGKDCRENMGFRHYRRLHLHLHLHHMQIVRIQ
jgi:hypothetical protein